MGHGAFVKGRWEGGMNYSCTKILPGVGIGEKHIISYILIMIPILKMYTPLDLNNNFTLN